MFTYFLWNKNQLILWPFRWYFPSIWWTLNLRGTYPIWLNTTDGSDLRPWVVVTIKVIETFSNGVYMEEIKSVIINTILARNKWEHYLSILIPFKVSIDKIAETLWELVSFTVFNLHFSGEMKILKNIEPYNSHLQSKGTWQAKRIPWINTENLFKSIIQRQVRENAFISWFGRSHIYV